MSSMTAHCLQIKYKGTGMDFKDHHSTVPSLLLAVCPISSLVIHTFSSHFLVILPGTYPTHLYLFFHPLAPIIIFWNLSPTSVNISIPSKLTYLPPFFMKCFLSTKTHYSAFIGIFALTLCSLWCEIFEKKCCLYSQL